MVRLSQVLFDNAHGFRVGAAEAVRRDHRGVALASACNAIELGLKSFLVAEGATDDENRRTIRHDLVKALAFAEARGLRLRRGWAPILAKVSPAHMRHGLDALGRETSLAEVRAVVAITREIAEAGARSRTRKGSASSRRPWTATLRAWGAARG
ncbi:hypothetical protein ACETK8_20255 (plasmid) [Brevundimonas staleyi]|uniref:HEPN domain-containing protein n=1 Tax=Brevundimonas staleyi TaxID=74326 RepID=A0ABW0FNY9_9CAUL